MNIRRSCSVPSASIPSDLDKFSSLINNIVNQLGLLEIPLLVWKIQKNGMNILILQELQELQELQDRFDFFGRSRILLNAGSFIWDRTPFRFYVEIVEESL